MWRLLWGRRPELEPEPVSAVVIVPPELQAFKAYVLRKMLPNIPIRYGNLLRRTIDDYIALYCR
jgi:hypothetical protein